MKNRILFYHANCPDGFGSAYAFWKKFKDDIEFCPITHDDIIPDVTGREVYMADIAPHKEVAIRMNEQAESFVILDHHISKVSELKEFDFFKYYSNNSGAVISWRYLFPRQEVPSLLRYVEDRDLYNFDLPHSDKVLLALDSINRDFESWDRFSKRLDNSFDEIVAEGELISHYRRSIMDIVKGSSHFLSILGYRVPAVNTSFLRTEVLAEMCKGHPFAAGYHYDGTKFIFSLRSDIKTNHKGIDVSEVAVKFGGGGHKAAAGFSVRSLEELYI